MPLPDVPVCPLWLPVFVSEPVLRLRLLFFCLADFEDELSSVVPELPLWAELDLSVGAVDPGVCAKAKGSVRTAANEVIKSFFIESPNRTGHSGDYRLITPITQ